MSDMVVRVNGQPVEAQRTTTAPPLTLVVTQTQPCWWRCGLSNGHAAGHVITSIWHIPGPKEEGQ